MEKRGEFTREELAQEIPKDRMLVGARDRLIRHHEELPKETKLRMTAIGKRDGVAKDVQDFVRSMVVRGVIPYAHDGERTKEEMMPEINAFLLTLADELPSALERGDGKPSPAKQYFQNLRGRRVPAAPGADFINPNSGKDMYRFGIWNNDDDWED